MKWTAEDMPDLNGKVAIVTGANSGLGHEEALELARHGARIIAACRNQEKGRAAVDKVRSEVPDADVELTKLDLADLGDVKRFSDEFRAKNQKLDLLVNNAGVMAIPKRQETADGFEMHFGTNHLGHFALTGQLMPTLLATPASRVVTLTSGAHRMGKIPFDNLQAEKGRYGKWLRYGQSKLANILFALELDRRLEAAGKGVVSAAAHPGFAATPLQDDTSFGPLRIFGQPPQMGVLPILYAATAPDVKGGEFFGPDKFFHQRGHPTREAPSKDARDPETAQRLWEESEKLTGERYEALSNGGAG